MKSKQQENILYYCNQPKPSFIYKYKTKWVDHLRKNVLSLLKGTKESVVEKLLLVVPETKLWGKQILLDYFDRRTCTSYYKKGCFHQIVIKSVKNWDLWVVFEKPLKTFFWGPRTKVGAHFMGCYYDFYPNISIIFLWKLTKIKSR